MLGFKGTNRILVVLGIIVLLSVTLTFAKVSAGPAPTFNLKTLDYPGASQTDAWGLNDRNQTVGEYYDTPSTPPCYTDAHSYVWCGHGYLQNSGHYQSVNGPNNSPVQAFFDINEQNEAVGQTPPHFYGIGNGFLYNLTNSQSSPLPAAPGACSSGNQTVTGPSGINDLGLIVGSYEDCSGAVHGFILTGFPGSSPVFTTFNDPSASGIGTWAWGISDVGLIVGYYQSGGQWHGFLRYPNATYTTIDFPASQSPTGTVSDTYLRSINYQGFIVGHYTDGKNVSHGFRYQLGYGVFATLDFPSANQTYAYGINDAGWMVGSYVNATGGAHGFIANEVVIAIQSPTLIGWNILGIIAVIGLLRVIAAKKMKR
jgi:hypothetical protein